MAAKIVEVEPYDLVVFGGAWNEEFE